MAARRTSQNKSLVFDPAPSVAFGAEVLQTVKAPHAIIGRIAMWYWLEDTSDHEYTKDVDFAVASADMPAIMSMLSHTDAETRQLPIGGVNAAIPSEGVKTDFIDRSSEEWGNLQPLYLDAINHANHRDDVIREGGFVVPVASPEHLVAMKLGAGTEKDDRDAVRLLACVSDVDVNVVRQLVRKYLGPASIGRIEEALRRAGHPMARKAYGRS